MYRRDTEAYKKGYLIERMQSVWYISKDPRVFGQSKSHGESHVVDLIMLRGSPSYVGPAFFSTARTDSVPSSSSFDFFLPGKYPIQ